MSKQSVKNVIKSRNEVLGRQHDAIILGAAPPGSAIDSASVSVNDSADINSKTEQLNSSGNVKHNPETSDGSGSVNDSADINSKTEQLNGSGSLKHNTETSDGSGSTNESADGNSKTEQLNGSGNQHGSVPAATPTSQRRPTTSKKSGDLMDILNPRKERIEDTHTRDTFLIRNDLLDRFNSMAAGQPKGFKMRMINYCLEKGLNEIEGKPSDRNK